MYTILYELFARFIGSVVIRLLERNGGPKRFVGFPPTLVNSHTFISGNLKIRYVVENLNGSRTIEGKGRLHDIVEILTSAYGVNLLSPEKLGDDATYDHVCELMEDTMKEIIDDNVMEHMLRIKTVSDIIQTLGNDISYNRKLTGAESVLSLSKEKLHENMKMIMEEESKYPTKRSFTDFIAKNIVRSEEQTLISAVCKCYPQFVNYTINVLGISYVILSMVLAFLCCIPATLALATFLLQQNPHTNFGLVVLFIWVFSIVFGVILTIYSLSSTIKEYRLDKEAPKQSVMDFADDNGNKYRVHFTLY